MMSHRDDLINYISDAHKDAYGFRPRHINFDVMSIADLEREADELSDAVGRAIDAENARIVGAEAEFEMLIFNTKSLGAKCRKTAIRWIASAFNDPDAGYICYMMGIGYGYQKEIEAAMVS